MIIIVILLFLISVVSLANIIMDEKDKNKGE